MYPVSCFVSVPGRPAFFWDGGGEGWPGRGELEYNRVGKDWGSCGQEVLYERRINKKNLKIRGGVFPICTLNILCV